MQNYKNYNGFALIVNIIVLLVNQIKFVQIADMVFI